MHRIAAIMVLALVLANAAPAGAADVRTRQSLAGVREVVETFVRDELGGPGEFDGIEIDRLDPRLRLAACGERLSTWLPRGQPKAGRFTVGVRCKAPKPWKLYVPVQVTRVVEVITVARPLPRGATVTVADIELDRRNVSRLRSSWYTEPDQVLGQEARRPLRSGEVIDAGMLTAPRLVRRGQNLMLQAKSDTVSVSMKGVALEDGGRDQVIRVRNLSSNRVLQARVVGRDRVRVIF